jgi:hypothetical protein
MFVLKVNGLSQSNSKNLSVSVRIYLYLGSQVETSQQGTALSVDFTHRTTTQIL